MKRKAPSNFRVGDQGASDARDVTAQFFANEGALLFTKRRKRGEMDRDTGPQAGALALLHLSVPEEYAGAGGDFGHKAEILIEAAHDNRASPGHGIHSRIVAHDVLAFGIEDQIKRWLPKMASGKLIGALAKTEPSTVSGVQSIKVKSLKGSNISSLSGHKASSANGQHANLVIVTARTDPDTGSKGISLAMVETDGADGFTRGRNLGKIGRQVSDTSEFLFDEVAVPPENNPGNQEGQAVSR